MHCGPVLTRGQQLPPSSRYDSPKASRHCQGLSGQKVELSWARNPTLKNDGTGTLSCVCKEMRKLLLGVAWKPEDPTKTGYNGREDDFDKEWGDIPKRTPGVASSPRFS